MSNLTPGSTLNGTIRDRLSFDKQLETTEFNIDSEPVFGRLQLIDPRTGEFIYTPDVDYSGADSFVIRASMQNGGVELVLVNVTVNGPAQNDDEEEEQQETTPEQKIASLMTGQLPATLADTGLFTLDASGNIANPLTLSAAARDLTNSSFTPIQRAFSEYTDKDRYIILPSGQTVTFSENGNWSYPGSPLVI